MVTFIVDTDKMYRGRIQFAFVVVGEDGDKAAEMDANMDSATRSFPQLYNGLFIGHPDASSLMNLREGTGGEFGNLVLTNVGEDNFAVTQSDCGSETRGQTLPTNRFSTAGNVDYLYFSPNNVITGPARNDSEWFNFENSDCTNCCAAWSTTNGVFLDDTSTILENVPFMPSPSSAMDPTPIEGSVLFPDRRRHRRLLFNKINPRAANRGLSGSVDEVPNDGFFESVPFLGM